MVSLHAVPNAGYPQVFTTYVTINGLRELMDDRLPPTVGYRHYMELPVDWLLEVIGGHWVYGTYRDSNEGSYTPGAQVVSIGYDDSGGPGVDFSNLVVYVEKIEMNDPRSATAGKLERTLDYFNLTTTTFHIALTDGAGDTGYAVLLKKEPANWEDDSSGGREVSAVTAGGNVSSSGNGLACGDGIGNALVLDGATWSMSIGASGVAHRQADPANPVEDDWSWTVTNIT
jgi:hypothetical protein